MGQLKIAEVKKRIKELHKKQKFYLDKENDEFIYYYPKFSEKNYLLQLHIAKKTN
ncbi:hypothetical protein ABNX05_11560 [Lysinibacillus sp. M3]|uniref:Fur-regulated basic protein FbpA n=1 Tax=Lysinibacillus zambalensis TaxID=3160866 RepID=A0ABV1MRV9_9BACI